MTARIHGVTVAIDGPAAAGKSTVAKAVARALGYALVDTGAIYRAVALVAKRQQVPFENDAKLAEIVAGLAIRFELVGDTNRVFLGSEDVTELIRTPEISQASSYVSMRPAVRQGLLELQRRLAGQGGAVLEGRDIGTVVCPDAPVKFFLSASSEERARRRYQELLAKGGAPLYDEVLKELRDRDARDEARAVAPLKPAADATILDSTHVSATEVVARVVAAAQKASEAKRTASSHPN